MNNNEIKRVLITGNLGYVGPEVGKYLRNRHPNIHIIGYDTGFFAHSLSGVSLHPENYLNQQIFGDIREFNSDYLNGVDAVIHLSAISNDPMGNEFEHVTNEVNLEASIRLVQLAAKMGVSNFVFASSCSMYGAADAGARKESDPTNPLTAYAKSKIGVEEAVQKLGDLHGMTCTSLRFATACGMSDRLRLDLVLNDFVACACTTGEITVLSDGSPWRPLIDVKDMARAIDWAMQRRIENGGAFLAVNAGGSSNNYQVKALAECVARIIPNTTVSINTQAPPDKRSYMVDFSLFESLAPRYTPIISLDESIIQLRDGLARMNFKNNMFRESGLMRLNTLRAHLSAGRLDAELRWIR